MPDPKLQAAVLEIQAVLKKHDIGGVVLLASQTNTHFSYELCPSWSCARVEADGIRIKALRKDFASREAQQKVLTDTTGMILGFHTTLLHVAEQMQSLALVLGRHFEISHWDKLEPQ